MKKVFIAIITIVVLGLVSCEKDTIQEEMPGNIPGLGNTSGDIEISEKFVLPDGIRVAGDITGVEQEEGSEGQLKSANINWSYFGSGKYVTVKLTLENTSNIKRTVIFPKGLIWEAKTSGYQHGLQVQTTWVCISPNDSKYVVMHLFCVNQALLPSNADGSYYFLGITSSKVLWRFLDWIGWRKVNYEMIGDSGNNPQNSLKTSEVGYSFDEINEKLQAMIYKLTDEGTDLTEADKQFIDSIEEIPESERPKVDENGNYPVYFGEYGSVED